MNVDVNGRHVSISMESDEASALASVLSLVADMNSAQPIDRLYGLLLDNGVIDAGTAQIVPNPGYDPEMVPEPYVVESL